MGVEVAISPYIIEKLVLSHSSRSSGAKCKRRGYEFAQMFGKPQGAREDTFDADVGTALHEGLEAWMMTRDEDKAILAMGLAYPLEQEYLDPKNNNKSLEAAFSTLQALMKSPYLDEYEIAKIRRPDGVVISAVEIAFAIEIINSPFPLPVYYVGKIDLILRHRSLGNYIVTDLKSTRQWATDMRMKFEYDEQTVPYAIILSHILGEEIRALETAYLSAFVDLLDPLVSLYKIRKSPDMIRDWHTGLCEEIRQLSKFYKNQWWPRATNGDTCFAYKRACEFAEYCSVRQPSIISRMISGVPRKGLFSQGDPDFIIQAQLPYVELEG